jgi:hypothetical protein
LRANLSLDSNTNETTQPSGEIHMTVHNQNETSTENNFQRKRFALLAMALASAMIVPASALAADTTITVRIPAGSKQATEAKCTILAASTSFSGAYFTQSGGGVKCDIPAGKPGYGTKLTVGITNSSTMLRNTTSYTAGLIEEYVISSNQKNYLLQGNPPNCVTGTTYAYKTVFSGVVTVDAAYNNQIGTARFSLAGPSASFKAASSACGP